jgi:hypothetical protein
LSRQRRFLVFAPLRGKTGLGQFDIGGAAAEAAGRAIGGAISEGLWAGLVQAYLPWIVGGTVVLILLMSRK